MYVPGIIYSRYKNVRVFLHVSRLIEQIILSTTHDVIYKLDESQVYISGSLATPTIRVQTIYKMQTIFLLCFMSKPNYTMHNFVKIINLMSDFKIVVLTRLVYLFKYHHVIIRVERRVFFFLIRDRHSRNKNGQSGSFELRERKPQLPQRA